jgi:predicted outer membrane repeat protein
MFKKYLYKAVMLLAVFSLTISAMGMNTTSARAAGIIYVNTNASGANDGSSWGNAYLTLQDALAAAASGDQIWVAAGVYYPDAGVGQTNNSRSSTFTLINGVQIYGGFAGTETLLSERNISANVTILSGDLEQNDTNADADFTAETTADIVGDNAYHVVRGGDATATTILDGFTITAGNADGPTFDTQNGGGLFNWGTNPTVQNVIFSGNNAEETNFGYGGGVYNYIVTSPAQFTNIVFTGNNAHAGGGMAGDPDIIITDSTFINNTAANTGGGLDIAGNGGTLTNVSFTNNTATGGGALNITVGNLTLTNVTFSSNTADSAGAVNVYQGNPEFINVTFDNNTATDFYGGAVQLSQSAPIFRNVTFSNNSANISGGAIFSSTSSDPTLANVTFANNSAVNQGGGLYTGGSSDATLTNVTFSNNSAGLTGGGIYALNGTITLQNTIIANSTNGGDCVSGSVVFAGTGHNLIEATGSDACDLTNGVNSNIIGSDPILGTLTGSPAYFPLISGSPAINAGDNAACADAPVNNESQNGISRPQNSICDIGSYEAIVSLTLKSNSTYDGYIRESSETSNTGGLIDSTSATFTIGDDSSDRQHVAILHFDTSVLPDNAVITSTLLKVKEQSMAGTNPFTSLVSLYVDLKRPTFGLNILELTDFNAAAKKVKTAVFNSTPVSGWYTARFNNGGLANINLTGSTQLRLYFSLDDNDNAASDFFRMYSGNAAAGDRPKLVIQYYVP